MARPVRIEYPGASYYISSKGTEANPVFKGIKDRQEFLSILQTVSQRMHWAIYAYNLFSDSYQILIKTKEANLSKGMRQLNGIYTQRYNLKYQLNGNIFHGRFKAVLIEAEHSFEAVVQHILSLPLQQHKTRNIGKWKWSSYQASIGFIEPPCWLNTKELLKHFSKQKKRSQKILINKIGDYDKNYNLMTQVQGQILLGSEKFVNKWKKKLASGKVMDKARQRKEKPAKPLNAFAKRYKDPKIAMVNAYKTGNYTLGEVAENFDVHYSTVSRLVKKAESRL